MNSEKRCTHEDYTISMKWTSLNKAHKTAVIIILIIIIIIIIIII